MSTDGSSEFDAAQTLLDLKTSDIRESTNERSGNNKEYDVAQVLFCLFLGLQKSNSRESINETNYRKECEENARLFVGCLEASTSSRSNSAETNNLSKVSVTKRKTRNVATRTMEKSHHPELKIIEFTISQLRNKSKSMGETIKPNSQPVKTISRNTMDVSGNDNMVPIGNGNAVIPSRIMRTVNWTSYTCATRKLLMAVFPRRMLATSSLTGKPSPAFPNKPAKKQLDPALVSDIVQTVATRCGVSEKLVRTSITTKCADESKMFRTREKNKKKHERKSDENIPPELDSD